MPSPRPSTKPPPSTSDPSTRLDPSSSSSSSSSSSRSRLPGLRSLFLLALVGLLPLLIFSWIAPDLSKSGADWMLAFGRNARLLPSSSSSSQLQRVLKPQPASIMTSTATMATTTAGAAVGASTTAPVVSSLKLLPRPWHARMHDDHQWLRTFLTFSFAGHYDPQWTQFGPLRVINEDRIQPSTGFPPHPHSNFEIFSYVIGGALSHKDSMNNKETLHRGGIQYTRAGTGIRHSEFNDQGSKETHFMQIWFLPDEAYRRVPPMYFSSESPEELKRNRFLTMIKPSSSIFRDTAKRLGRPFTASTEEKSGLLPPGTAIPAHTSIVVRSVVLDPSHSATHTWGQDSDVEDLCSSSSASGGKAEERWAVLHRTMRSGYKDPSSATARQKASSEIPLTVTFSPSGEKVQLVEGDAIFIKGAQVGQSVTVHYPADAADEAELLLFDLRRGIKGEEGQEGDSEDEDDDEDY